MFNFHEGQDDDANGFDTMVVKEDDNDSEVRSLFLNRYSFVMDDQKNVRHSTYSLMSETD